MHTRPALWQKNILQVQPSQRHWLVDAGSLTLKLKKHCAQFQVTRINQTRAPLQLSEQAPLQRPTGRTILQRQVLLHCDGAPVVFAHTVTSIERVGRDWPFFNALGNKALGLALFSNPLIYRNPFEYAHLKSSDWLYQAAAQALRQSSFPYNLPATLLARRAVFQHEKHANSRMMVTEVMLPSVFLLTRKPES